MKRTELVVWPLWLDLASIQSLGLPQLMPTKPLRNSYTTAFDRYIFFVLFYFSLIAAIDDHHLPADTPLWYE